MRGNRKNQQLACVFTCRIDFFPSSSPLLCYVHHTVLLLNAIRWPFPFLSILQETTHTCIACATTQLPQAVLLTSAPARG